MPVSLNIRLSNFLLDSILRSLIAGAVYKILFMANVVAFINWSKAGTDYDILAKQALVATIIMVLYYFFFEVTLQRTPAKFITRTFVVRTDGHPPTVGDILLRSFVRIVPLEPLSFLSKLSTNIMHSIKNKTPFSFIDSITTAKGWHDTWSHTRVVREEMPNL